MDSDPDQLTPPTETIQVVVVPIVMAVIATMQVLIVSPSCSDTPRRA